MTDPQASSSTAPPAGPPADPATRRRPILWIGIAVVVALVLFVGGPFLYLNVIKDDAPPPLGLSTTPSTTAGASTGSTAAGGSGGGSSTGVDGTWTVTDGTEVGYRVQETLFGQSAEGVGRTSEVEGTLTIAGTEVSAAEFTVDMTTVTSDSTQRDGQFSGRIMDTATHPTATFALTAPVDLGSVPAEGEIVEVEATGDLTLRGVTKPVTVPLEAQVTGATIKVSGSIPITFADYEIDNPSGGPAQVGDTGTLEFLVVFAPA